jgi:hypothetical protein
MISFWISVVPPKEARPFYSLVRIGIAWAGEGGYVVDVLESPDEAEAGRSTHGRDVRWLRWSAGRPVGIVISTLLLIWTPWSCRI